MVSGKPHPASLDLELERPISRRVGEPVDRSPERAGDLVVQIERRPGLEREDEWRHDDRGKDIRPGRGIVEPADHAGGGQINAHFFGNGDTSGAAASSPLLEWRKGGRIISFLGRMDIAAVVLHGYNDTGRLRILNWCHDNGIPTFLWADSNSRSDHVAGLRRSVKKSLLKYVLGRCTGVMVCGTLGEAYGWHYGFGIAAIFMLVGLATYLIGYRHLPAKVERLTQTGERLSSADWRVVAALSAMIAIAVFQFASYYQLFNMFKIWIQEHVDLSVSDFKIPVPWFQSVDSFASILAVPLLFALWRWQASRRGEPREMTKIGIGAWLASASYLILVAAIVLSSGESIHPIWPVLCATGMGVAFMYQWPTVMALVSRTAPARINSTMMGFAFAALFVANLIVGWVGRFYEKMTPAQFWLLHAAIAAAGGVVIMVFGRMLERALVAGCDEPWQTL